MKRRFSVGCVKVFGLLKITENVNRNQEQINLTDIPFRLKIEDVRFAYEEGHLVLKRLSADFSSGQIVYITGVSGAGDRKSVV